MKTFKLKIYSSHKVFFDGLAVSLTIPATDGEFGILANHENMIIAIDNGLLRFTKEDGTREEAVVSQGFAEIIDNEVSILVMTAERPEEIDVLRAQQAKERAEERLRQKQSMLEYHQSKTSLARAMARLKAASKYK